MIKKLLETNLLLLNYLIGAVGCIVIAIGYMLPELYNAVGISVGCSLVATSLTTIFHARYLVRKQTTKEIIDTWGLYAIYPTRALMNVSCDKAQDTVKEHIDVIGFGLRSWRQTQKERITNALTRGVVIRILTIDPDSQFARQRSLDEGDLSGNIPKSIRDLIQWVDEMRNYGDIHVRVYKCLPMDFYFRIDDTLFIGPYLQGIASQQTVSYEYRRPGQMFTEYTRHFEDMWKLGEPIDYEQCRGSEFPAEFNYQALTKRKWAQPM